MCEQAIRYSFKGEITKTVHARELTHGIEDEQGGAWKFFILQRSASQPHGEAEAFGNFFNLAPPFNLAGRNNEKEIRDRELDEKTQRYNELEFYYVWDSE